MVLLAALLLAGCSTVPITGRRQLNFIPAEQETALGLSSFNQMKKEVPISKDPTVNALVQRVGKQIASVADLPGAQWEFVVFDSKEANAFCLPGGKVGIYTGILQITQTEAGLATVMGHEVAHAVAHHGASRMSEQIVAQLGGQILTGLSPNDPKTQALISTAYGAGTTVGVLLPHSRRDESEADELGLRYMARAGYNPQEAVSFWERFSAYNQKNGGGAQIAFLSTHPVDSTRIADLKKKMPTAMAEYQAAGRK